MRRSMTKVIFRYPSYLTTDAPFDSRWDSISFTLSLCQYFSAPVCRRHMHALSSSCTGWLRYTGTTDRDCPWLYSRDRLPLDILLPASSYGIACRVSHSTSLLSSLILLCNKQLFILSRMASREKYKIVNPYAVCHIMKQCGWTSHKKWQRCVYRG
jgi:hypothetical protein